MNIKFVPQDKKHPADKAVLTNVGEFRPGQVLSMLDYQEKEAQRLIENGDFVEVKDAANPKFAGTPSPEVQEKEELERDLADPKKSKK